MSYSRLYFPLWKVDNAEDINEYRPGGFHPVHLGDTFQDRYKVLHKLGAGGFSTTWLARDNAREEYVSLKILKAEESAISREVATLRRLAEIQSDHPGKQHIRMLQDDFQISGPNGNHQCLVFDLAGPSIAALYNVYGLGHTMGARRLRAETARKMNKQLVDAIDFFHTNHLCHGDIALPNVLFKLRPFDEMTESQIFEIFGTPKKHDLKPTPNNHDERSGPSYVVEPVNLPPAEYLLDEIFLVDFGEAFSWDRPPRPEDIGIPYMYRAPEAIFESKYNWQSEIWALACVL